MTIFHLHRYAPAFHGAGWIEKQEGQQSIMVCPGMLEWCRCGTVRIVPDDKALRSVEIDVGRKMK